MPTYVPATGRCSPVQYDTHMLSAGVGHQEASVSADHGVRRLINQATVQAVNYQVRPASAAHHHWLNSPQGATSPLCKGLRPGLSQLHKSICLHKRFILGRRAPHDMNGTHGNDNTHLWRTAVFMIAPLLSLLHQEYLCCHLCQISSRLSDHN